LKEKLAIVVNYERIIGSRMMRLLSILFVVSLLGVSRTGAAAAGSASVSQFDQEIRPLFESRCYECHGPQKQKSGLRLDRKSSAFQGGDSGKPAVVPGKSAESVLLQKITSKDSDEVMPPKGEKLTAAQIDMIKQWIDAGAGWTEQENKPKHWAYIAPARASLPKVKNTKWPRNGIDFFVMERLEKEKLKPSPQADPAILIRRLSLDLTGLPPTPAEIDEFVADKSPLAYERLVDRLLASPHYGERWARPWLDLARYADTQGYEKDNRRTIWPYRDWVISALNRNIPFDEFTIEQLAGDLLPNASREQKVATGFHRNTMTNTEGGTDDEEFRHEAIVDRVNTTMSVWMGTTFGCAQCHNHKYDPITTKEYYQFYSFLNNTADADKEDEAPTMKLPTPQQEKRLAELRKQIKETEAKYNTMTPELVKTQSAWEEKTLSVLTNWQVVDALEYKSLGGATLMKSNDLSIVASGLNPSNDTYTIIGKLDVPSLTGVRLEVLTDSSLPEKSLGRHINGSFVLNRFEAELAPPNDPTNFASIRFKTAKADYSQDGYPVTNLLATTTNAGWAVSAGNPQFRTNRAAYFLMTNATTIEPGSMLRVTLRHQSRFGPANIGRFRISATRQEKPDALVSLPEPTSKILRKTPDERSDKEKEELSKYFRSVAPELKPVRDEVAKLKESESKLDKSIPLTSVMAELEKPRQTFRLVRGGFLNKAEPVSAGIPAVFHPLPKGEPTNRLTLAHWLMDTNNPLTARVTVNRIWEQYFGIGIVETTQDFGIQGEPPSNQKLLDWLSIQFMDLHWDLKALHKLIVMSAAYQQSSKARPELLQRDPYNRLLARGPHVRLEAEQIRDQALAVSGLLSPKMGGPSVMPPQPDGLWQLVYSGDKWDTSKGEDRYRRGVYTFWRRSMPHPAMTTFDAPTREYCVLKRDRSDTPLQALVLLNDPEYVEAAQALARRVLREAKPSDEDRITYAFRLCLGRAPERAEVKRLLTLVSTERENFGHDTDAAKEFANVPKKEGTSENPADLAAWTVLGNVLLNLDETVMKN